MVIASKPKRTVRVDLTKTTTASLPVFTSELYYSINPLSPTVAIGVPVPDRVKLSFVIFDIRAL